MDLSFPGLFGMKMMEMYGNGSISLRLKLNCHKNYKMGNIVNGITGLINLVFSIVALITGLLVLVTTKGTKQHRRIGYLYSISLLMLNITAFYKFVGIGITIVMIIGIFFL